MSRLGKLLLLLAGIHFISGLLRMLPAFASTPFDKIMAIIYLGCVVCGVIGCKVAFSGKYSLARWLLLFSLVATSIVFGIKPLRTAFPSVIKVNLVQINGKVMYGVNLASLLILVGLMRTLPKQPSPSPAEGA